MDESYYRYGKQQGVSRSEFLYYKVSTGKYYRIEDYAGYKGRKLYIFERKAALGVALAVGAVIAGVGSTAAAATYMDDKENSTASPIGTYISNSITASLIAAGMMATFWAAPYAAQVLTMEITQGLPLVAVFGQVITA